MDTSHLEITPEMLALIAEIDSFKGAWLLLGLLAPDRLQQLKKVATIESIGSSTRIEGAKLSDREVDQLLSNIEGRSLISRDEQEVAGYAYVCDEIFQDFETIPFSENHIKQLHGWLLQYSEKDERHRGHYKKIANHIEAFDENGKSLGFLFETASPFETPFKMQELVVWTTSQLEQKSVHPLLIIAIFIVTFLAIHPFQDGNGRLSRILTTWLLLKLGYRYVPYSSLESIIEKSREGYYRALRQTQSTLKSDSPDYHPWLIFFLRALHKQKTHLEQKVSREKAMLHLPELRVRIINLIQEHGRLTVSAIEQLTQANRNTLKKHLSHLTEEGTLLRLGKGKGTWYTLP